jgi:hypothetical protein
MIRRGFWLTAGAVTGIYGYRRVCAVGRRLSARLDPAKPVADRTRQASLARRASPARQASLTRQARLAGRGAIGMARETFRFTRDVREGMDLYMARYSGPAGSTLGARGREANDQTNEDPRPKDGH